MKGFWTCIPWLIPYLIDVIPLVDRFMQDLKLRAQAIPDAGLRVQALASLENKAFHCYGGAVLALLAPKEKRAEVIEAIVCLQTISDYLDNLCDRAGVCDEKAFAGLHRAMLAAVDPGIPAQDYYYDYKAGREEVYLVYLIRRCRELGGGFPSLPQVRPLIMEYIGYYSALQTLKHLDTRQRLQRLREYVETSINNPYNLFWWELAAATGSTLAVFALLASAAWPSFPLAQAGQISKAYFPWICALHILLDYYIDQEEDRQNCDLNFVAFYPDEAAKYSALREFARKSMEQAAALPAGELHLLVVRGLLAMYLSDPKVLSRPYGKSVAGLLDAGGRGTRLLYRICRLVRAHKSV